MITDSWTELRPHDMQSQMWRTNSRFVAAACGRGSGKTELARRRLVRFLPVKKKWADPRYFYGAPTLQQAKRIAWDKILGLVPKEWVANIRYADLVIETIFGSELHVVGLDKPQRIEGDQWDGCVLDESCDLKPGVFNLNILPALTHRNGWCWRIGVPKRHGIGRDDFKGFFDSTASQSFAWPSSDILEPEALQYARENLDPVDYREQFEATWEHSTGQVFHAFDKDLNIRPCPYRPDKVLIVGSDFNINPMCWVIGHKWNNRIEIIDELFLRDTNTVAALDVLYHRYASHDSGWEFYGDATGRARKTSANTSDYIQIYNDSRFQKKISYPKGNPAFVDRIAACNAMFCNADGDRRFFVSPHCKRLIHDLEIRSWKPASREAADTGDVGHITDALGYAIYRLFPIILNYPKAKVLTNV